MHRGVEHPVVASAFRRECVGTERLAIPFLLDLSLPRMGSRISLAWLARHVKRLKGEISILGIVLGGTTLLHSEQVKAQIPWFASAELWIHGVLSQLNPRPANVKFVVPVEIDDVFWSPPLSGRTPTNRRYLAELVRKAHQRGATAIGLDFRLTSATGTPQDDPSYAEENEYLLRTIREVAETTPVILTDFLVSRTQDGSSQWWKVPNIYPDDLPGVTRGHINMPRDGRQIPLQMAALEWDGSKMGPSDSFAEAIVAARERAAALSTKTVEDAAIVHAHREGEFVFGGFIPLGQFRLDMVTSKELLAELPRASGRCCRERVVLIGGTWHQHGPNTGPWIESSASPVGPLPRLYMHANYVESLLDHRYHEGVAPGTSLLADLILGVAIYWTYGWRRRWWIIPLMMAPLLMAYVVLATTGLYFDAMLPLLLCFVHVAWEHYSHVRGGHHASEA